MDAKEQEFLRRLQATFRVEADEHLRALSAGLFELERSADPQDRAQIVETIFREAHSLKGAARSVNVQDVESLCQAVENGLSSLKRGTIGLSPGLLDLLHQAVETLTELVSTLGQPRSGPERAHLRNLRGQLNEAAQPAAQEPSLPPAADGEPTPAPPPARRDPSPSSPVETAAPAAPQAPFAGESNGPLHLARPVAEPSLTETVRIPLAKLDPLLRQAEEMIQVKLAAGQRAADLREIQQALAEWRAGWAAWQLHAGGAPLAGEMAEWMVERFDGLAALVAALSQEFVQDRRALGQMVDEHLDDMKRVLMLPVSTLVESFPRLVRDLARDQAKEIELVIRGAEIEIDKRILEELKDPLIHFLRNCVDHGIEQADVRSRRGKSVRGHIRLEFNTRESRYLEVLLADDGGGIDTERVRAAAQRAGALSSDGAGKLTDAEILPLIFQSGVSTSELLTDISGRGLGLAIVREKVEGLGGMVAVESRPGQGTTFRLRLPLSLATFRGVLVRSNDQLFVVPTAQLDRVLRVHPSEIGTVENRQTIRVDGQVFGLVNLGQMLALPSVADKGRAARDRQTTAEERLPVLVLTFAEKRLAVQVDEVVGEEEVLVKGLGRQLSRVRNIAGATILGGGKVVPVLNVADLMTSAVRAPGEAQPMAAPATPAREAHILVAEDSITSRTLLKSILESGGYRVATAVDGVDAFTQLRSVDFDLLVSDVDMPRMSGFELTTRIRNDTKLADLPVVLVTALGSREDRERGIEAGANAYIVKSSFDQSNLLEVVQRLL